MKSFHSCRRAIIALTTSTFGACFSYVPFCAYLGLWSLYHEDGLQSAPQLSVGQYIEVPAGVATFPKDLTYPPRELGERFLRVARWTEMPRGGHFAALEVPELLVEDIRSFLRPLRSH